MSEQLTCGKGLAARSNLPSRVANVAAALADVLSFHQKSLDDRDAAAATELGRYRDLAERFRVTATSLASTAEVMAESRDLPPAPHDVTVLSDAENSAIFEKFVNAERDLLALLEKSMPQDEAMLRSMRDQSRGI